MILKVNRCNWRRHNSVTVCYGSFNVSANSTDNTRFPPVCRSSVSLCSSILYCFRVIRRWEYCDLEIWLSCYSKSSKLHHSVDCMYVPVGVTVTVATSGIVSRYI